MYKNLKFKHNLNKFIFITDKGSAMMLEKKQYWMTLLLAAVAFFILFIATYFISANGSKAATLMAGQVTEAKITSTLTADQQLQITKIVPSTKILLCLENDAKEDIESVTLNANSLLGLTEEELQARFKEYSVETFSEDEVKLVKTVDRDELAVEVNAVKNYALGIEGEELCIKEVGTGTIVGHIARKATDFSSYLYSLFLKESITITEVQKESLLKDPSVLQRILQDYVGE